MAITDYATLKTTIADYLHRDDLSDAVVSNFVQFAENRLNRKLRLLEMERYDQSITLSSGNSTATLPTGWLETIDLIYDSDKVALTTQNLKMLNTQKTTSSGRPRSYATSNGALVFEMPADQNYTLKMDHFTKWDIVTDDTNWLLTNAPDAYLYGSLLEAKAYTKKQEDVILWAEGLKTAMNDLNRLDNRTRRNVVARVDKAISRGKRYDINRG